MPEALDKLVNGGRPVTHGCVGEHGWKSGRAGNGAAPAVRRDAGGLNYPEEFSLAEEFSSYSTKSLRQAKSLRYTGAGRCLRGLRGQCARVG